MRINRRVRSSSSLANSRWGSYFAAAAATAISGTPCAHGEIHYSGLVDFRFLKGHGIQKHTFPLSQGVNLIGIREAFGGGDSSATFEIKGAAVSNAFRAYTTFSSSFAAALPRGAVISQGRFGFGFGTIVEVLQDYNCDFPDWQAAGTYYLGFRFDGGAGKQYGWMRIRWGGCSNDGATPNNTYEVRDYAWGDPGDQVKAGQKKLKQDEAAPNTEAPVVRTEGSLGLLALGAVGLTAWRKRRLGAAE